MNQDRSPALSSSRQFSILSGRGRWAAVLLLVLLALAVPSVAAATPGVLTAVDWSVTSSQTGATSVTYGFSFTLATGGANVSYLTMSVPPGTSGTPELGRRFGLLFDSGTTVGLFDDTLTITVSPATQAPLSGVPLYVEVSGLTNTSEAGTYRSTIKVYPSEPTGDATDAGESPQVEFGSTGVAMTVQVAQTLIFTNDTPSFTLGLNPLDIGGEGDHSAKTLTLTVRTNAPQGYSLAVYDGANGLFKSTTPTYTIPAVTDGPSEGVEDFPDRGVGFSAHLSTGGDDGAVWAAGLRDGKWVGYPSSSESILTTTGPTGADEVDTVVLTHQVAVDFGVPAGTYSDTVTIIVTPNY